MEDPDIRRRLGQVGELLNGFAPGAVDELFDSMRAIEEENPAALDREKIAKWCTNMFFDRMQARVLQHPKSAYSQRILTVAYRLEHPLLLNHIIETIAHSVKGSSVDPLNSFDELLSLMPVRH